VIKNFRAIEDVNFELTRYVNVIVGPNAVGKTTILQAIRLTKALVAPRSPNEAMQTLISLGAASPHFPQRVFVGSLARDLNKPVEVRCTLKLENQEVQQIVGNQDEIATHLLQAQLGQSFNNPAASLQFLASPAGQSALATIKDALSARLKALQIDRNLVLGVALDPQTNNITVTEQFGGPLFAYLEQLLLPQMAIFSYFPADRALPTGEVNVQLGGPDMQQQLEAHNSQPQLKYHRLKNMIIGDLVLNQGNRDALVEEFGRIFDNILRGRRISTIGVNELGLLSVKIQDQAGGTPYDIDGLSSGEKNLTLTLLLIARSISDNGLALIDEPELHLNPAVCKDVLGFLLNNYAKPKGLQFVISTHSPEILSGAFRDGDCALLHIVSPNNIARVGHQAFDEYSEVLAKLGSSVSEALLYEGTLFVEGDDDVSFLETGFSDLLKRYKVKDRGGRREVEKTARRLQELETKGQKVDPVFLLFDRDDDVTSLTSSKSVRIMQWERRCLENYLIDLSVITELLKTETVTRKPVSNEGEVATLFRKLALSQLDGIVASEVYKQFGYKSPTLRSEDIDSHELLGDMASALYDRAESSRASITLKNQESWTQEFLALCAARRKELEVVWEARWKENCDGKRLFRDFCKVGGLKIPLSAFKNQIVGRMRDTSSENWRVVESRLKELIHGSRLAAS
jgi:energy-coupling factor transporter ATP-binding protein EcfA2